MNRYKMSIHKNVRGICAALLILVLFFQFDQVHSQGNLPLIGYQAADSGTSAQAVLYFRYGDSELLGQETRIINIPHTQREEMALVQALLDGPSETAGYFKPLFSNTAEVLSVLEEGNQLFVTFNEGILAAVQGDELLLPGGDSQAVLRRQLMIASLVNTLTETGRYKSIQVLVMSNSGTSASMRLNARVFMESSDAPLPPFTRQEERIITAGKAAEYAMRFWQQQRWDMLQQYTKLSSQSVRGVSAAMDFSLLPTLLSWQLSNGSISPDGAYAVVTLSAQVMDKKGLLHELSGYPMRLEKQHGVWKLSDVSLLMISEDFQ